MSRGIPYTSSPLLASRTPVWRSKFVVAAVALSFAALAARAVYIQILANDFYLRQGEVRFARTLPIPASRGRIIDRNVTAALGAIAVTYPDGKFSMTGSITAAGQRLWNTRASKKGRRNGP